ncbi:MAG: hypothetical protein NVSMB24_29990 [Mucilaginibacter sp.]
MKAFPIITITILSGLLLSASCKKHVVTPQDELAKLPPATQIGANTFGCLVNGAAFLPDGSNFSLGPIKQCNYIYTGGGYHFTVAASNKNNSSLIKGIIMGTDSLAIAEGQTLTFKTFASGNAVASYTLYTNTANINEYTTNNTVSGQLTITKLDSIKDFVSGTFYFTAVNDKGEKVQVTDGRFDMLYTR